MDGAGGNNIGWDRMLDGLIPFVYLGRPTFASVDQIHVRLQPGTAHMTVVRSRHIPVSRPGLLLPLFAALLPDDTDDITQDTPRQIRSFMASRQGPRFHGSHTSV